MRRVLVIDDEEDVCPKGPALSFLRSRLGIRRQLERSRAISLTVIWLSQPQSKGFANSSCVTLTAPKSRCLAPFFSIKRA
jgi:hypothetical protein